VAALVVLRLCLGWHFLYEGIWKVTHRDEFSAEPFLSQAKGPMSRFFYGMIPDQYGRQRLRIESVQDKNGKTHECIDTEPIAARWGEIRQNLVTFFDPGPPASDEAREAYEKFKSDSKETLEKSLASLNASFADKETVEPIKAYFK
jgi:hypothetical protein